MIESIAIIGAGNMGSGIAQKSATEGFSVQMVDREQQWVDKGHGTIENFLREALERRIFSHDKAEDIKRRITGVVGNENVSPDTDLVARNKVLEQEKLELVEEKARIIEEVRLGMPLSDVRIGQAGGGGA